MHREGDRRAAVLVPFVEGETLEVLFTRRTEGLGAHAGQISFPGGRIDAGDADELAAALRETEEELGIPRAEIEVLGELDGVVTSSSFSITPIAGLLRGRPVVRPSAREVAEVLYVPFSVFASVEEAVYRHGEVTIWGATARIMRQLVVSLRSR
jgi:8-oxo-dGTP pyrophosphatase MutT (NUDIX family)